MKHLHFLQHSRVSAGFVYTNPGWKWLEALRISYPETCAGPVGWPSFGSGGIASSAGAAAITLYSDSALGWISTDCFQLEPNDKQQ